MSVCPDCNGSGTDAVKTARARRSGGFSSGAYIRCWTCVGNGIVPPYPNSTTRPPGLTPQACELNGSLEIHHMAYATLNAAQAATIRLARQAASTSDRKAIKKEVFMAAKAHFGIPADHKLVAEVDATQANFGVLKNKATGRTYPLASDGLWVDAARENGTTAEPKFWLKVDADTARRLLIDDLASDGKDSSDAAPLPDTATRHALAQDLAVDTNGDVYVQVTESELV